MSRSCNRLCEACTSLASIVLLNVFVVMLILKLDTADLLKQWSWPLVLLPLGLSMALLALSQGIGGLDEQTDESKPLLGKPDHRDDKASLMFMADRMTPASIGNYYRAAIFFLILSMMSSLVAVLVGLFASIVPRCGCQTQLPLLVAIMTGLIAARVLLRLYETNAQYGTFTHVVAALTTYHVTPNAKRLVDFGRWYTATVTNWSYQTLMTLDLFLVGATIATSLATSVSVRTNSCMSACPDVFMQTQHFLFAQYALEAMNLSRVVFCRVYAGSINLGGFYQRIADKPDLYQAIEPDKHSKGVSNATG